MGTAGKIITVVLLALALSVPSVASAREGDCGYEGGISSGENAGKTTFEYQEICFVTGEPIVLKGTLTLKKSLKGEVVNSTYTYYLKNTDKAVTLTRVLVFNTKYVKKSNGQTVEETSFSKTPSETVKIGSVSYVLKNYDYTRTNIIDTKPSINYFSGNTWGKKTYQVANNTGTVTVEATGSFYGYDQYWGSAEVQLINYLIESEQKKGNEIDRWGGTASVSLSTSVSKKLEYVENEPLHISFSGGYIQTQYNSSILEYSCKLPEFDSKGISTDNLITGKDSLRIETFPVQTRLPVYDFKQLKGHWAENEIETLYSLEIFKGGEDIFNPEQYMTRAQFTDAVVGAAREVPQDPVLAGKTSAVRVATSSKAKQELVSPFYDVLVGNEFFASIDSAYKRGLIGGVGNNYFNPNGVITSADAATILIKALGLESLSPGPHAVTTFKDNDEIPSYARDAVYVAERIGLVQADSKGYLKPDESLTKAKAAVLINKFIEYMREGIRTDYRDGIINYN